MAIDYTTARGKVRAMIPDISETDPILSDGQLDAFLSVSGDNIKKAVSMAWRAIATETNLLYKYVKTDDLLVDGPKMAAELLKSAKELYAEAVEDIAEESADTFEVVPYEYTLEDSWRSLGRTF